MQMGLWFLGVLVVWFDSFVLRSMYKGPEMKCFKRETWKDGLIRMCLGSCCYNMFLNTSPLFRDSIISEYLLAIIKVITLWIWRIDQWFFGLWWVFLSQVDPSRSRLLCDVGKGINSLPGKCLGCLACAQVKTINYVFIHGWPPEHISKETQILMPRFPEVGEVCPGDEDDEDIFCFMNRYRFLWLK